MEELVKKGALGAILCSSGIITEEDIRLALEEQRVSGGRFGEALVKLGIVKQEDIDWALSNQLDIPYVRLNDKTIDRAALELVPAELARKYNLIPIIRTGDELHIALADPLNRAAVEEVEQVTGCTVTISIPIIRELREMLDICYGPAEEEISFGFSSPSFTAPILEKINADRSGTRLVEYLVLFFLQNGVSSICLQPAGGCVRVSGRRGRVFREIGSFPLSSYPDLVASIRKISRINGSREPAVQGDFVFRYRDADVHFQVSMVRALEGECITIKLQPDHSFPADFHEMGIDPDMAAGLRSLASSASGLILFVSWNRTDRARFLDLFLDESNTGGRNILLLGEGIGKGKRSFPRISLPESSPEEMEVAVAALLDHDPDAIVLEEATETRSFSAAWKAAMQGTLVVAGISRGGLGGALEYLLHERQGNRSLAGGIRGIVAFSSVRTLCPSCKQSFKPDNNGSDPEPAEVRFHAPGCPACSYSGYGDKKYLLDVVPFYLAIQRQFAVARDSSEILAYLTSTGYRGIAEQLAAMLKTGDISPEEYAAVLAQ